jgi:hypothetical protein
MRLSLLGLVMLMTACGPSNPAPRDSELRQTPAWTMHSITLYLPTPVIEQRVPTAVLGDYIKDLRVRASNA